MSTNKEIEKKSMKNKTKKINKKSPRNDEDLGDLPLDYEEDTVPANEEDEPLKNSEDNKNRDITIFQGAEVPFLEEFKTMKAVEDFFHKLKTLRTSRKNLDIDRKKYFSDKCLRTLELIRLVDEWPEDTEEKVDNITDDELRRRLLIYLGRTNATGSTKSGTSMRAQLAALKLKFDGRTMTQLTKLESQVHQITTICDEEWEKLSIPERKDTLKFFLQEVIMVKLRDGEKHPQHFLYTAMRPKVDSGIIHDLKELMMEIQIFAIKHIIDKVNEVNEFAEVVIKHPWQTEVITSVTGKRSQKSWAFDRSEVKRPKFNAPGSSTSASAASAPAGGGMGRSSERNVDCYFCGRPHSPTICLLSGHPDANRDPNVSWVASQKGKEWSVKVPGIRHLPMTKTLDAHANWKAPEQLLTKTAIGGNKQFSNSKSKGQNISNYIDHHTISLQNDAHKNHNLPMVDVVISNRDGKNCQIVTALLDSGAEANFVNMALFEEFVEKCSTSSCKLKKKVCNAFGNCTDINDTIPIRFKIMKNDEEIIEFEDFVHVIDSTFSLILGYPTIKRNNLTDKLHHLFAEVRFPPEVVRDDVNTSSISMPKGDDIPNHNTVSTSAFVSVIEETPISNQFRSCTCDEDQPPIVGLSSPKRCDLGELSRAVILNSIYHQAELLDDLNKLSYEEENEFWKDDISSLLRNNEKSSSKSNIILPIIHGESSFHDELRILLKEYGDTFSTNVSITPAKVQPMDIQVNESLWKTNANRGPPRPQSTAKQTALIGILNNLLEQKIIQPSQATEYSQVLLVPKPDKSWRLCIDYRSLNATITSMGWPIPNIKRLLHRLGNKKAKYYGILDLTSGYHQVMLSKQSKKYAAFITDFGVFEPNRISMGLKTAPAYFQQQLALALHGLLYACCELYIDDIIIFGKDQSEFVANLRKILERLRSYHILIHPLKAKIGLERLEYVGHIIDQKGLSMSKDKIDKVLNFPLPKTIKQLKQFLGLVNYFRDHIPHMSTVSQVLYQYISNYAAVKFEKVNWTDEAMESFNQLVKAISSCQKLYFMDEQAPIYLETDASDYGIGAYLYQLVDGTQQPIVFLSKTLSKVQQRWSTIEKECYAIWYALKSLEHLLRDVHFTLRTDHRNLTYMNINSPKVVRWKLAIQEFDFNVEYIKGENNIMADGLSRLCQDDDQQSEERNAIMLNLIASKTQLDSFSLSQEEYKTISSIHNTQNGHFGVELTIKKLENMNIKMESMRQKVKYFIHQRCSICQKLAMVKNVIISKPFTAASYAPMDRISIDSIGPLPEATGGYQHILVVIDNFTRFVELYPCITLEAEEAVRHIITHCGRYGTPNQILSDGGTQFDNAKMQKICELLSTQHIVTMPYSKQENAIVERANKEVLRHLRAYIYEKRVLEDWYLCLPMVQRIINSTIHVQIGASPAQLLFGNAVDLDRGLYVRLEQPQEAQDDPQGDTNYRDWYDNMLGKQAILLGIAARLQEEADLSHIRGLIPGLPTEFSIGSYVLAKYPPTAMGHKPPTKLHTPWRGPYRVINVNGAKYTLQDLVTMRNEDVHVSLLKSFHFDPAETDPLTVALADSNSFIVERILDHRGDIKRVSTLEFKVKWLGYEEPDWQPWSNVRTTEKLHEYLTSIGLQRLIPRPFRVQATVI